MVQIQSKEGTTGSGKKSNKQAPRKKQEEKEKGIKERETRVGGGKGVRETGEEMREQKARGQRSERGKEVGKGRVHSVSGGTNGRGPEIEIEKKKKKERGKEV